MKPGERTPAERLRDHGRLLVRRAVKREDWITDALLDLAAGDQQQWTPHLLLGNYVCSLTHKKSLKYLQLEKNLTISHNQELTRGFRNPRTMGAAAGDSYARINRNNRRPRMAANHHHPRNSDK
jgi:hypothetical protein